MIDLHSHVLPGIDDGPSDINESVELLGAAAAQGTAVLAATPHLRADFPLVDLGRLADACAELNERALADATVCVVPGAEVDLLWAQSASDEDLRLASFRQRGSDLLIETPYGELPGAFEELLFQISVRGYRVLLAHPERSLTFQRNPMRLRDIASRGVLIQITLPSVIGRDRRSRSRRLVAALVREGLAHNLASDAHSAGPWRPPYLRDAVDAIAELAPARAEWMVTDAPAAILEGEPLPPPPSDRERPRRRLRLPGQRR
jgi:protein-tyrosine phosphatase